MSGLPKKYARMGFKKGWAAYKRSKPTKRHKMAKRKTYVRRKATSYSRGLLSAGSFNSTINGVLGGAAAGLINKFVGNKIPFGNAISYIGAGYLLKNSTLQTLGGITLGQSLLGGIGGNGNGTSNLFEG